MSKALKSSAEIRAAFIEFFKNKQHTHVQSSSLIPAEDPTLLFNNAGMNQFKSVFTGEETRSYNKAVSVQKCVRAGGKHNDLENVGYTARHHTFFEMLGNFSFGDYFKKEAIAHAWEFITQHLQFDVGKLHVTVFHDDETAYGIWKNDIGVDPAHIHRFGEKDNFWSMGETGPCGPCSEIFYDQGEQVPGEKMGDDSDRFLEFWNLVFMEFEQKKDGSRIALPKPSIDTGMGLERVSSLAQGVLSNYDSDTFAPILDQLAKYMNFASYSQVDKNKQPSMRVIADHVRCMNFLISDGVLPSNEGRGYVLRRVMRRAMRHARKLDLKESILYRFSDTLAEQMSGAYPELKKHAKQNSAIIVKEEERFAQTIDRGLGLLQEEIKNLKQNKSTVLSGDVAFHLYDTYGFPVDMTADILKEHGFAIDERAYDQAFDAHREKARGSWKKNAQDDLSEVESQWKQQGLSNEFVGYDQLECETEVLAIVKGAKLVNSVDSGAEARVVFKQTPFYAESGGQVGDIGVAVNAQCSLDIVDTQKHLHSLHVHAIKVKEGTLRLGDMLKVSVDAKARAKTAKNHTATHMLHAALIKVLGEHVRQKGSLVSPERLRFDFANDGPVQASQLEEVEHMINDKIWQGSTLKIESMSMDKAMSSGAMALFGEKYGEEVRVVAIDDFSVELCGGTHLNDIHEIGMFKIVKESSVSAGVRRIEALTHQSAYQYMYSAQKQQDNIAKALSCHKDKILDKITSLKEKKKQAKTESAANKADIEAAQTKQKNKVTYVWQSFDEVPVKDLRELADRYMEKIKSGVVVLGAKQADKAFILCKISKDLIEKDKTQFHAGQWVKKAAEVLGGSGGGRPDMAQAGGHKFDKLDAAIAMLVNQE